MNPRILMQPSSMAGFAALGLAATQYLSAGIPTSTVGWIGFAGSMLASVLAILRDDGTGHAVGAAPR